MGDVPDCGQEMETDRNGALYRALLQKFHFDSGGSVRRSSPLASESQMSYYSHAEVAERRQSSAAHLLALAFVFTGAVATFLLVAGLAEHQNRSRDLVLTFLLGLAYLGARQFTGRDRSP
jgi:hypothetical protein